MKRYDIAIIGTGPAGLSAAINAKIRNKTLVLFGPENLSDKVSRAPQIENYLGLPRVSGVEIVADFRAHLEDMAIETTDRRIQTVYAMGDYFALLDSDNAMWEASAVVLATGWAQDKPLPGEEEFLGRGLGYCATCDAALYKGKKVVIVGYNEESVEDANFVEEIAGEVVFVPMGVDTATLKDTIKLYYGKPKAIEGDTQARKLVLDTDTLEADGIFLIKNSSRPTQLVPGLANADGKVVVDRNMATNIPGLYAAGDVTGGHYQYMKSAGEGQVAALEAVKYLAKLKVDN